MGDEHMLTHAEVKNYYDRFGQKQDSQGFYERRALENMIDHSRFDEAKVVFELGCGTGKLSEALLENKLPSDATYFGVDVSSTMVVLTRERIARFGEQAHCQAFDGQLPLPAEDERFDRFIACYVFDLLPKKEIDAMLKEAWRCLKPGGLICLVGLTEGSTFISRLVSGIWRWIHHINPALVGGCRPIKINGLLSQKQWRLQHHTMTISCGVPSEVLIAERLG